MNKEKNNKNEAPCMIITKMKTIKDVLEIKQNLQKDSLIKLKRQFL